MQHAATKKDKKMFFFFFFFFVVYTIRCSGAHLDRKGDFWIDRAAA